MRCSHLDSPNFFLLGHASYPKKIRLNPSFEHLAPISAAALDSNRQLVFFVADVAAGGPWNSLAPPCRAGCRAGSARPSGSARAAARLATTRTPLDPAAAPLRRRARRSPRRPTRAAYSGEISARLTSESLTRREKPPLAKRRSRARPPLLVAAGPHPSRMGPVLR